MIPKLFSIRESKGKQALGVVSTKVFKIYKLEPKNEFFAEMDLIDLMASFAVALEKLIEEATENLSDNDKVQVILSDDNGVMEYPVSTSLTAKSDFDFQQFLLMAYQYFQSGGKSIKISDGLKLEIVIVSKKKDSNANKGGKRYKCLSIKEAIKDKHSCVEVKNKDNLCMSRCVAIGLIQKEVIKDVTWKTIIESKKTAQTRIAKWVCTKAKIKETDKCGIEEAKKIEKAFEITIKILDGNAFLNLVYAGQKEKEDFPVLYLLRTQLENKEFHYDYISNIQKFLGKRFYCNVCDIAYTEIHQHTCSDIEDWCYTCYGRHCKKEKNFKEKCSICSRRFRNVHCKKRHELSTSNCKIYKCFDCNAVLFRKKNDSNSTEWETNFDLMQRHGKCKTKCNVCKMFVEPGHVCFMTRTPYKKRVKKAVYIDFETEFTSGEHIPVFCCISWVFESENGVKEEEDTICFGVSSNVSEEVGAFLFSEKFKDSTVIAHNFRGFDCCFLIQYLTKNNIKPTNIILNGTKVNYMYIKRLNMRLIDSLNLTPISLSLFSKSFGLKEADKGFFPYRFIREENFDYCGPYPDKSEYGYFEMKPEVQKEFDKWYPPDGIFDFRKQIADYCIQDVRILKEGVEQYRELIDKISVLCGEENKTPFVLETSTSPLTTQVAFKVLDESPNSFEIKKADESEPQSCDPIAYTTLASLCHGIFKAKYLRENTIAQVPAGGYTNHKYSNRSLEWLEFLNESENRNIIHRLNSPSGTEVNVLKYRVDGFEESSKTVFEFYGCFYHGHPKCIFNMNSKNPVSKVSYEVLFRRTLQRQLSIKKAGFQVIHMWECEWEKMKQEAKNEDDHPITKFLKKCKIPQPLNPFDAFFGGRVETFTCLNNNENEAKKYVDVTSLYPFTCATKLYPVGHPTILLRNLGTSLDPYFGFIQCTVLPPRQLKIPVLPVKTSGKLFFPLCLKCIYERVFNYCPHSDEERSFSGVWFSKELELAVKKGYKIVKISQVYHFKHQSTKLFEAFMNDLYKIKLLATGEPAGVDLNEFIEQVKQKERIDLKGCKFEKNPGLRYIAKILLNSFWGRFALRENQPSFKFISSVSELYELIENANYDIKAIRPISESVLGVSYVFKEKGLTDISNERNVYLAATTTAWARISLYEYIDKLSTPTETQVDYVDTDGIMYNTCRAPFNSLSVGNFMGDLTNELRENEFITIFMSAGPKNYAFITNLGNGCVKVKGFSLHAENLKAFNCHSLKRIIENYVKENCNERGFVQIRDLKTLKKHAKQNREEFSKIHEATPLKSSALANLFAISVYNPNKISRTNTWIVLSRSEQKLFIFHYDKRIIRNDYSTIPFGYCEF